MGWSQKMPTVRRSLTVATRSAHPVTGFSPCQPSLRRLASCWLARHSRSLLGVRSQTRYHHNVIFMPYTPGGGGRQAETMNYERGTMNENLNASSVRGKLGEEKANKAAISGQCTVTRFSGRN